MKTDRPAGHPRRFYTVAEAAQLLRTCDMTLYRSIRAGEFPAVRIRGRYVVPAKAIDAMETGALTNGLVNAADYTIRSVA
ncbi:helix-turn-helix domain-containing protein [Micromonospora tulbaghiae]|uniref:helix-turn-helix domain-containing protein n=1 Tax=Micromonospora tulbaghiae TaxID=479978 RepID=UPI0029C497CD|nr:helix-turn-helix domain-containing protein [Micromonospora tulbaghiae]MDX5460187.1 helix-turn-helix domain-containing protein [Micromonospora tulbaghiae]